MNKFKAIPKLKLLYINRFYYLYLLNENKSTINLVSFP